MKDWFNNLEEPERWAYRVTFAILGVFVGLCVWVVRYPFEEWSVAFFGIAFYLTQIAAVLSGLVVIFTPDAVKRSR